MLPRAGLGSEERVLSCACLADRGGVVLRFLVCGDGCGMGNASHLDSLVLALCARVRDAELDLVALASSISKSASDEWQKTASPPSSGVMKLKVVAAWNAEPLPVMILPRTPLMRLSLRRSARLPPSSRVPPLLSSPPTATKALLEAGGAVLRRFAITLRRVVMSYCGSPWVSRCSSIWSCRRCL